MAIRGLSALPPFATSFLCPAVLVFEVVEGSSDAAVAWFAVGSELCYGSSASPAIIRPHRRRCHLPSNNLGGLRLITLGTCAKGATGWQKFDIRERLHKASLDSRAKSLRSFGLMDP
jgi:hypothetical protein